MIWVYVLISFVLIVQVAIFIISRRIRKREREKNVLFRYKINSRQKAWQLLADPDIPDEDKKKIKEYYEAE